MDSGHGPPEADRGKGNGANGTEYDDDCQENQKACHDDLDLRPKKDDFARVL